MEEIDLNRTERGRRNHVAIIRIGGRTLLSLLLYCSSP